MTRQIHPYPASLGQEAVVPVPSHDPIAVEVKVVFCSSSAAARGAMLLQAKGLDVSQEVGSRQVRVFTDALESLAYELKYMSTVEV